MNIPWNYKLDTLSKKMNYDMDNPNIWQIQFNRMQDEKYKNQGLLKRPYDIFNLTSGGGHRTKNHDLLSSMMVAAMNARAAGMPTSAGVLMAYSHLAADNFSNHLIKSLGNVESKNIFEALYSWTQRKNR